jgi:hypothetical protein
MTTDLPESLTRLGDALEAAGRNDPARPAPRRRGVPRRSVLLVAAIAVIVPSAAIAADHFISNEQVAAGLPAGTFSLIGTEPTCVTVHEGVEYHCTLTRAPAPEVPDWKGTVEPTVDATRHVNGGCRGLTSDGREWQCYLGQAAVDQQIISADFLGQTSPGPGHG